MPENEIRITFILNCALMSFIKNGESVADIKCKYDKEHLRGLEKFVKTFVKRNNYHSAKVIFKHGNGAPDISGIIKSIQKGGIEIISMSDVSKTKLSKSVSEKESNNG